MNLFAIFIFFIFQNAPAKAPLCMDPDFQSVAGEAVDCLNSEYPNVCRGQIYLGVATVSATYFSTREIKNDMKARRVVDNMKSGYYKDTESLDDLLKKLEKFGYKGTFLKENRIKLGKIKSDWESLKKNQKNMNRNQYIKESLRLQSEQFDFFKKFNYWHDGEPTNNRVRGQTFKKTAMATGVFMGIEQLSPIVLNWANKKICSKKLNFVSEEDIDTFTEYADVYTSCETEINNEKFQHLKNLSFEDRKNIFEKSPTLCKLYEDQGLRYTKALQEITPIVDKKKIRCLSNEVILPYKIGSLNKTARFIKNNEKIIFVGSFVNEEGTVNYDETNYKITFKDDLTWSSVSTPNTVWGTAPGAANLINKPAYLKKFVGENIEACSKTLRKSEVNTMQSTVGLYCAVGKGYIIANQLLGDLFNYCPSFGEPQDVTNRPSAVKK